MYIVLNFLRRFDAIDWMRAAEIVLKCYSSRRELVSAITEFLAYKLGKEVLSSIAVAFV